MMDEAKFEIFGNFAIFNKALLFLIKLNKTVVQSVPTILISLVIRSFIGSYIPVNERQVGKS